MLKYTEDYQLRIFTSLGINYIIYNKILNGNCRNTQGKQEKHTIKLYKH